MAAESMDPRPEIVAIRVNKPAINTPHATVPRLVV